MKKNLLTLLAGLFVSTLCASCQQNFNTMKADDFEKLILAKMDSITVLDVRTQAEYNEGHIPNAININVMDKSFLDLSNELVDKMKPVAVYCKSGRRSKEAANQLTKAGFKVYNLAGGINEWIEAKKPVSE